MKSSYVNPSGDRPRALARFAGRIGARTSLESAGESHGKYRHIVAIEFEACPSGTGGASGSVIGGKAKHREFGNYNVDIARSICCNPLAFRGLRDER